MVSEKKSSKSSLFFDIFKMVFLACFFLLLTFRIYPHEIFKIITKILGYIYDSEVNWEKAPFLKLLLLVGANIVFSFALTKGLYNKFKKASFFNNIQWRESFIIAFCLVFYFQLSFELRYLLPDYTDRESGGTPDILSTMLFFLTILLGYLLWPQKGRH